MKFLLYYNYTVTMRPERYSRQGSNQANLHKIPVKELSTRKLSCVNARDIPTAAHQVLHMLFYPGGYLPWLGGGGYLPWHTPHPNLAREGRVPTLARGYLPWGTPPIYTWLGYTPPPSRPGRGTPLPGVNRLKTLPFPILRMQSVKIVCEG